MRKFLSVIGMAVALVAISATSVNAGGTDSKVVFGSITGPNGNCANWVTAQPTVGGFVLKRESYELDHAQVKFGLVVRLSAKATYDVAFADIYRSPAGDGCAAIKVGSFTTHGSGLGWFSGTAQHWAGSPEGQIIICEHADGSTVSCLGSYGGSWASLPIAL